MLHTSSLHIKSYTQLQISNSLPDTKHELRNIVVWCTCDVVCTLLSSVWR